MDKHRESHRHGLAAGLLDGGVEREWQRAGDAGNVGSEGDDRAELTQSGGKCGQQPGENSGQHQGQGDGEEAVERPRAERAGRGLEPPVDALERQPDGTHHEGKGHDGRGQRGARGAEGQLDPEMRQQPPPGGAAAVERHEQQVTDGHRREHEGQMHQGIERQRAREAASGEELGDEDGERQAEQRRCAARSRD